MSRIAIKISLLLASAAWSAPAWAQSVGSTAGVGNDNPSAQDAPPVEPADSDPSTAGEANDLADIVVTAQRREERLVDVPLSVTAIGAETLEAAGVNGSIGLSTLTPGLNFSVQGAYAQPTIRGIGTSITGAGADANVAIYIDGVYQPSQAANVFEFNNIERVEVLKGPQGTLFGRNATGGAITITTLQPSFNSHANLSIGYGSFNEWRASGYATVGLTDTLAADIAVLYSDDDGYTRNVLLNRRSSESTNFAARAKLLWQPTDALSFTLIGNISDNEDNSIYITRPIDGNNQYFRTIPGTAVPADIRETNTDTDPRVDAESKSISLIGRYNFASGTLSSISSYTDTNVYLLIDSDVTSNRISSNGTSLPQETFTQELNFASDLGGRFNFIAGLFYYNDTAGRTSTNTAGAGGATTNQFTVEVQTEAAAIYGELTFDITDRLHLLGGVRYSTETRDAFGVQIVGPARTLDVTQDYGAWTPRVALRYDIDDRSRIYGSYSRGFKSGIFNTTALNDPSPVRPETVDAFELGFKHASRNLIFSLAGFHYNYRDIQVGIQTNVGGISQGVIQNAASAEIYGAEAEVTAVLSENFNLRAGAAWTHGRYVDFTNALITERIAGGGNRQFAGDASGRDTIRTPEFTANLTLNYNVQLAGGNFDASVTGSYNGGFYWDPGNRVRQDEYALLNARISWLDPSERFRVALWGTNLTDTEYYYYASVSGAGDSASFQRPRSVGISLTTYIK